MVEVTPEDRKAAAAVLGGAAPDGLLEGRKDDLSIVQAFARHRIAAEQRGKLEGARLAIEAAAGELERQDGFGEWFEAANHIRALSPAKIVGEG